MTAAHKIAESFRFLPITPENAGSEGLDSFASKSQVCNWWGRILLIDSKLRRLLSVSSTCDAECWWGKITTGSHENDREEGGVGYQNNMVKIIHAEMC